MLRPRSSSSRRVRRRVQGRVLAVAALALVATAVPVEVASAAPPDPGSIVKVNQVAYVPGMPKQATLVSGSSAPVAWTLRDSGGTVVASGQSTVRGADALSGDSVHHIDFSSFDTVGTGYVLSAAGASSHPFDITADAVKKLRYDALAFFYHQRSGTPIESQYVGGRYARPAGHLNVSPNQGDNNVPCRAPCGYTMDVRGGWYDAGDHGKYVVNGGISVWQLVNEYERTLHVTGADRAALGDGTLAIPERGNGVPDILDEARWEVEFLLKMQVPDGRTDAGMARHKISDQNWTGLPLRPDQDPQPRVLSAVSTAATLNLAAVAAQAARVWKDIDPAFAARALAAAQKAYSAAKANPARYADPNDGNGSGTYADGNVTDEFYWAAAELYVTTGSASYRSDVTGSSLFRGAGFNERGFDWGWTPGLGDTTLAMVPNGLSSGDVSAIRSAIAGYADKLLAEAGNQGYPAPTGASDGYYWGSNSTVANSANVMALAYDFTGQSKYRNGVYQALDYLFGRNPFNFSYVTGYGEDPARNVHHRFWANQLDSSTPIAPPGVLSGGPNTGLEDPVAKERLAGCRPQKCYLDHIDAWSLNEVTVNWNSALAWLAAWAAEKAGSGTSNDTTAPSAPTGLSASGTTATGTRLTWTAATDNVGVTGYEVLRAPGTSGGTFTAVATTTATSHTDSGLEPANTYRYQIRARDAAGNQSAPSDVVLVTTPSSGGSGGCSVDATSQSQWETGYVVQPIMVTNTGDSTIQSWTVTFTLPAGHRVTGFWNADVTVSGQTATARGVASNRTLAPGATAQWGYQASRPNSGAVASGYSCTAS